MIYTFIFTYFVSYNNNFKHLFTQNAYFYHKMKNISGMIIKKSFKIITNFNSK